MNILNYHVPNPEMKNYIIREKLRCGELKRRKPTKDKVIQLVRCERTINVLETVYPILKKTN